MTNLGQKIRFAEMVRLLERMLGISELSNMRDSLPIEHPILTEKYHDQIIGEEFSEDMAMKTVVKLLERQNRSVEAKVAIGTGAIIMCEDGSVYSEFKGSFNELAAFLTSVSGKTCTVHLAVAMASKVKAVECRHFTFELKVRCILASCLKMLKTDDLPDRIDFLDILLRFEHNGGPDMRFSRENAIRSVCHTLLLEHVDAISEQQAILAVESV